MVRFVLLVLKKLLTGLGRALLGKLEDEMRFGNNYDNVTKKFWLLKLNFVNLPNRINSIIYFNMRINLKPLSVNGAWQGKRFKTPAYKKYEADMLILLPNKAFSFTSKAKISVRYTFGFSNSSSDLANPEKLVTDILVKKYGFDDRQIYEMHLSKVIVKKGFEFIDIQIEEIC